MAMATSAATDPQGNKPKKTFFYQDDYFVYSNQGRSKKYWAPRRGSAQQHAFPQRQYAGSHPTTPPPEHATHRPQQQEQQKHQQRNIKQARDQHGDIIHTAPQPIAAAPPYMPTSPESVDQWFDDAHQRVAEANGVNQDNTVAAYDDGNGLLRQSMGSPSSVSSSTSPLSHSALLHTLPPLYFAGPPMPAAAFALPVERPAGIPATFPTGAVGAGHQASAGFAYIPYPFYPHPQAPHLAPIPNSAPPPPPPPSVLPAITPGGLPSPTNSIVTSGDRDNISNPSSAAGSVSPMPAPSSHLSYTSLTGVSFTRNGDGQLMLLATTPDGLCVPVLLPDKLSEHLQHVASQRFS
ncbi:hypothetical protein RI367_005295 [Sorochytrium milnesiophthora]